MVIAMIALTSGVFANPTTNVIPWNDDFEQYTNGTPLIDGTNGWYGDSGSNIVQTNTVCTGTKAAMIPETCTLSNRFQNMAISSNIWVQMDLQPILFDGTNNPVADTNLAALFYVNSNGNFVVHNGPTADPSNSTSWVALTNVTVAETNWTKIQMRFNFAAKNWSLYVNSSLVTNSIGFVNTNLTNFGGLDVFNGLSTSYMDNVSVVSPATIRFEPLVLTPTVIQGEWTSETYRVSYDGMGVVSYTMTTNQPWLVLSPSGGSLTGQMDTATNTIVVTYTNTSGLTIGTHHGTITISSPNVAGSTNTLPVTLTVQAVPMLNVSPMLMTNTVMQGQNPAPLTQTLLAWNGSADYGIGYRVTTNVTWLAVQVTNNYLAPLTTNTLTVQYTNVNLLTPAGDAPSNYTGEIVITATNASGSQASGSPVTIPVKVQVNPRPRLALNLTNMSQTVLQGHDAGSQWFEIWNSNGFYTLNYTVSKGVTPWLVLTPTSGSSTGQHVRIEVQYSTANLSTGSTYAVITVAGRAWDGVNEDSALSTPQQIAVTLSVTPFATLTTDAQTTNCVVRKGANWDTVWNVWSGGNPVNAMYFTVSPSVSWLKVAPSSGTSTGDKVPIEVQADITGMNPGVVYSGTVQINATDAGSGQTAYGSPKTFTIEIVVHEFKGFDFQGGGSGASDLVVYQEASGNWAIKNLLSAYATNLVFGGVGYQAVPGDYSGDGITEMGVYRQASGSWYAWQVGAESLQTLEMKTWIGTGYTGVPGDYDGDGKVDPCVYLETNGLWMMLMSGSGYQQLSWLFGGLGYAALRAGDYDGDGKVDPSVYHRVSGLWMLRLSGTSYSDVSGTFGGSGFISVPTDYDGDGITDPAIYETGSGRWYILPSTTLTSQGYSTSMYQFGGPAISATLVPAPGDYDGVGGADLGLYDPTTGCWYISTMGGVLIAWGYPLGGIGYQPVLP